jgi:hypothetical protein
MLDRPQLIDRAFDATLRDELEVRVSEKGVGLGLPAGNPMGAASNSKILPLGDGWRGRPCFL